MITALNPYIRLMRLDKPTGIWLLMLPCWWGALSIAPEGNLPWREMALLAIGALLMRSCGCILNDLADRTIDAQVARTRSRPLASGELQPQDAYWLVTLLLCAALGVAMALGWRIAALGACWLPLVALYPYMKRWTWWPQAFLGVTFGAGSLFGALAVSGSIPLQAWLLYAGTMLWVIGYDTIYACQDREDDARIGVKSTARWFGSHVVGAVGLCFALSWCCLSAAFIVTEQPKAQALALMATAWIWWRQNRRFDPAHPGVCMALFKQQVWVGLLLCAAYVRM